MVHHKHVRADGIDFDDEDAVLAEMAEALDIDVDELQIDEDRGLTGFGEGTVYEITILRGRNGKEWKVVADYDQMHNLAVEIVKQDLDEDPSNFNQDFIEQHINMTRLRRDLEDDVLNANIDRAAETAEHDPDDFWRDYERAGFDAPEEDDDGERRNPDQGEIEELAEEQTKEELKDPMQYLDDIYGDEAVKKAIEIAGIDIDAAAQDAVDTDGAEHFVSHYDNNSYTTKSGLVYWRSN